MTSAATLAAWHRVNWRQVCLNLRRRYKPLAHIAREIGASPQKLLNIACGDTEKPRDYEVGLKLLDLHRDHCPDLHRPDLIMHPEQERLL